MGEGDALHVAHAFIHYHILTKKMNRKRAGPFPVRIYDYMYNYAVQQDGRPFSCTYLQLYA